MIRKVHWVSRISALEWLVWGIVALVCSFDFVYRIWDAGGQPIISADAKEAESSFDDVSITRVGEDLSVKVVDYFRSYGQGSNEQLANDSEKSDSSAPSNVSNDKRKGFVDIEGNLYQLTAVFKANTKDYAIAVVKKREPNQHKSIELTLGSKIDNLTMVTVNSRSIVLKSERGDEYMLSLFPLKQNSDSRRMNKVVNDE